jgi:hypothetical protein
VISLSIAVPNNDQIMQSGYTLIRVSKSSTGTNAGPYSTVSPDITMVLGTSAYTFLDMAGVNGDWYLYQFVNGSTLSSASDPQPAYLPLICVAIRDLLGVTTVEAPDSIVQEYSFLPNALARVRQRVATFDTIIHAGGDNAALGLAALAHLVASLLCPRMALQVMELEQFKDYRYQRNRQMDWEAHQAGLLTTYEVLISQAASETPLNTALYPSPVLLAGPTSSGTDTSGGLIQLENDLLPYTNWIQRGNAT